MFETRLAVYAVMARQERFGLSWSHDEPFQRRGVTEETVAAALTGPRTEIIALYDQDARGNATLVLGYVEGRALHLVLTEPDDEAFIVITAYWPDERPGRWSPDYRRRMP